MNGQLYKSERHYRLDHHFHDAPPARPRKIVNYGTGDDPKWAPCLNCKGKCPVPQACLQAERTEATPSTLAWLYVAVVIVAAIFAVVFGS